MRLFSADEIDAALSFPALIDTLAEAFRSDGVMPPRNHYAIERPGDKGVLLVMPAWSAPSVEKGYIGTKVVSVFFSNGKRNLPGVMGAYLLMDGDTASRWPSSTAIASRSGVRRPPRRSPPATWRARRPRKC
jgi:ornithine cyclodeaminase/alanine dehydrogenase-like protein (mu-crystallin family)